jgi:hypothetical protein
VNERMARLDGGIGRLTRRRSGLRMDA